MNFLNEPSQGPSLTEQVLNQGSSLSERILQENQEQSLAEKILEPAETVEYLSKEESDRATEQSKHVNGADGPEIYTVQELEDANEYERERVLDTEEDLSIAKTIGASMSEGADLRGLQRNAAISAWNRYVTDKMQLPSGLDEADMLQTQLDVNATTDPLGESTMLLQRKQNIVNRVFKEINDAILGRGVVKGFFTKYFDAWKNMIPGYSEALRADYMGEGLIGIFNTKQSTLDLHELWSKLMTDSNVSPEQFESILRAKVGHLMNSTGATWEDARGFMHSAFGANPDTLFARAEIAADVAIVGGAAYDVVSAAIKHGAKGAAIAATKSIAPYLSSKGVKSVVKGSSHPIETLKKFGDISNLVSRKRFVGDIVGASESAISKTNSNPKEYTKLKEFLGDPDVINTKPAKDTEQAKTVIQTILDTALDPSETVSTSTASSAKVVSSRQYSRLVHGLVDSLQESKSTQTLRGLEQTLIESPSVAEAAEHLLYKWSGAEDKKVQIGEVIKAIQADTLQVDSKDNLVVRFRLPHEFKNEEEAKQFATEMLNGYYTAGVEFPHLSNGKVALDIDMNVRKGFGTLLKEAVDSTGRTEWAGKTLSAVATVTSNPDYIRSLDVVHSANIDLLEGQANMAKAALKGLTKEEKQQIEMVLRATWDTATPGWFSPELLSSKGYSNNFVNAYNQLRAISDLHFLVLNDARRTGMMREGFRTITVNGKSLGYGKVHFSGETEKAIEYLKKNPDRYIIFGDIDQKPIRLSDYNEAFLSDSETAKALRPESPENISKGDVGLLAKNTEIQSQMPLLYDKIRTGDMVIVEAMYSPKGNLSGSEILYVLPKNSVVQSDLPAIVINYVPGWRRYFDRDAVYVKQGRMVGDNVVGVNTVFSSTNAKEVKSNVDKINDLIRFYATSDWRDLGTLSEIQRKSKAVRSLIDSNNAIMQDLTRRVQEAQIPFAPFHDGPSFVEWASKAGIDITHERNLLEIVKNGEVPLSVKTGVLFGDQSVLKKDTIDLARKGLPFESMMAEWEQRQLHRSGSTIFDYDFSEAITVDVDKTLQYLVDDMSRYGVLPRYEEIYAEAFGSDFREFLLKKLQLSTKTTNEELLKYTDLTAALSSEKIAEDKKMLASAITAQKNYAMIRQIPTAFDREVSAVGQGILSFIGASADTLRIPTKLQNGVAGAFNWVMDKKPVAFAQAIAAHRFLGFLNPVQFFKNFLGPASLIVASEGSNAFKALKDLLWLPHMLQKSDDELNQIIKKLHTALGTTASESDIILNNMLKLDSRSAGIKGGLLGAAQSGNKYSRASLFFFNRADLMNRAMAFDTAIRRFGYNTKEIPNAVELGKVGAYADSLYINMSRRGLSRMQRQHSLKVFTQFTGYLFKYIETVCCDKLLTPAQRTRMAIMSLSTAGVGGFLGYNAYNSIASSFGFGKDETDGEVASYIKGLIQDGMIDATLRALDVDVSVQNWFGPNVLENIASTLDKSFLDYMKKVPAVAVITDYSGVVADTAHFMWDKYSNAGSYSKWSELLNIFLTERKLFSSVELLKRAYDMYMTGMRFSASGQLTTEDNSKLQALLVLAGLDSQKLREIYLSQSRRQKSREEYEELLKELQPKANMAARGNRAAQAILDSSIEASNLSDVQKFELRTALSRNSIRQGYIPLEFREAIESTKAKLKLREPTYLY